MEVFIIAVQTADGFIARSVEQRSFDWTSKADKRWHVRQTKQAGAVIFGRQTFETFNRPLPGRLNLIYSRSKSEEFAQVSISELKEKKGQTQLYYTSLPPAKIIEKLDQAGYPGLSVSGGSSVYQIFLASRAVNKLFLSIEPVLFGEGLSIFKQKISNVNLDLVKVHHLSEQTVALEYKVNYEN